MLPQLEPWGLRWRRRWDLGHLLLPALRVVVSPHTTHQEGEILRVGAAVAHVRLKAVIVRDPLGELLDPIDKSCVNGRLHDRH